MLVNLIDKAPSMALDALSIQHMIGIAACNRSHLFNDLCKFPSNNATNSYCVENKCAILLCKKLSDV